MWTSSQLDRRSQLDGGPARLIVRQPLTADIAIHLAAIIEHAVKAHRELNTFVAAIVSLFVDSVTARDSGVIHLSFHWPLR